MIIWNVNAAWGLAFTCAKKRPEEMGAVKVLLIDDEETFLEVMGARIKGWGYEVIEAIGGKKGIEALKDKKPDVIILDYFMSGMDGIATLKEIRKINGEIPVVIFTAYPDERSLKGTEGLGVVAYIPKFSAYSDVHASLKSAIKMVEKQLGKGCA